jgi:hypothetical protein
LLINREVEKYESKLLNKPKSFEREYDSFLFKSSSRRSPNASKSPTSSFFLRESYKCSIFVQIRNTSLRNSHEHELPLGNVVFLDDL